MSSQTHRFRSTTGCLTCRRRKKKCDEAKPRCTGCTRNHLTCDWPPACKVQGPRCQSPTGENSQLTPPSISHRDSLDNPTIARKPNIDEEITYPHRAYITWSGSADSFLSPLRATMLTPTSTTLLSHYLTETGTLLSTLPSTNSPFLALHVPLALNDDLLMHSLLALSGSHLSFRNPTLEIQKATARHYGEAISTLRAAIDNISGVNIEKKLKILMALMNLSFFEALSDNAHGAMFFHLRAGRSLIIDLIQGASHLKFSEDNQRLFNFVLEIYSYLVLTNTITPLGAIEERDLPFDCFLGNLGSMSHQSESFGAIFGGSHELFGLLPSISQLSSRRLTESHVSPSSENWEIYWSIQSRIDSWTPPGVEPCNPTWLSERDHFLNACRISVRIYLETAMHAPGHGDRATQDLLQGYIDEFMLEASTLVNSPFETILLWPVVIAGSCMTRDDQQDSVRRYLHSSRFQMRHCLQVASLLERVWDEPDERICGPYGLSVMMKKHGINIGIA